MTLLAAQPPWWVAGLWTAFAGVLVYAAQRRDDGKRRMGRLTRLSIPLLGLGCVAVTALYVGVRIRETGVSVTVFRVDADRTSKLPARDLAGCLANPACLAIVNGLTEARVQDERLRFTRQLGLEPVNNGNDVVFTVTPPPGWRICRLAVRTIDVRPALGTDAPTLEFTSRADKASFKTVFNSTLGLENTFYAGDVAVAFVSERLVKSSFQGVLRAEHCKGTEASRWECVCTVPDAPSDREPSPPVASIACQGRGLDPRFRKALVAYARETKQPLGPDADYVSPGHRFRSCGNYNH